MPEYLNSTKIEQLIRNPKNKPDIAFYNPRRPYDYARQMAMLKFIRTLEEKYGDSFKIKSAHPCLIERKNNDNIEYLFSLGFWVGFMLDDVRYSLSINENPYFESYITRARNLPDKKPAYVINQPKFELIEYSDKCGINDILYSKTDWSDSEENIEQFSKNLMEAFTIRRNAAVNHVYERKKPHDTDCQRIYGLSNI